ncbi:MAG: DUF3581 family protein [Gammaproteobacteria bacterium]
MLRYLLMADPHHGGALAHLSATIGLSMFLDDYHQYDQGRVLISADQASAFAKLVAGDFNPIHDADSKRFCVPGDLLFSLVLAHHGVSPRMCFVFAGMVGRDVPLGFAPTDAQAFDVQDDKGRTYLKVEREGAADQDADRVAALARAYVQFSGKTFPHLLVPLMADAGVMINPERPLVIYERMAVELDRTVFGEPELKYAGGELKASGKRGEVSLEFELTDADGVFGTGVKRMLLSGLRPYEQAAMDGVVEAYEGWRSHYLSAQAAD